jgi:hypothetical protein
MAAPAPAGSDIIQEVNFNTIPAGKWADAANPQYVRMMALRAQLADMQVLWAAVAAATNADVAAVTATYDALKAGPKIVNLGTGVFLGGSRKKRQSKKKKNSKHNNKNNQ